MYTLDDYNAAKDKLQALNQRWENYSGNNPDKYRTSITEAEAKVRVIDAALKADGTLERTPREDLERRIDLAFPNARSKQAVEFEGRRYIRRFIPSRKSLSGKTVKEWDKFWEDVTP